LRRGGQPRARPRFPNAVLADRPQTHQYQLAPPSARLRKQGMPPLRSPLGRSPHHCSVDFFEKRPSPHPFYKKGAGIPAPSKGAGIGNAQGKNVSILIVWCRLDSLSTRCWITIVMRSNDSTAYISHQRASLSMSILPQQHSRSHTTPFLIAVILTLYVETVFAKIIVSSVRPNRGSLAGGTRIHIQVILCSLSNHDVKSTLI